MNKLARGVKLVVHLVNANTKTLLYKMGLVKPRLKESYSDWKEKAQKFEFDFHKKNAFRQTEAFMTETAVLFESFGFSPGQYAGKTVVDIGAGSKLRAKYFKGAEIVAVEPMADQCMAEIPWCDLADADAVYSGPAEEMIGELAGRADLVFSINVLDHCYDFEKIIENIYHYLKPDGLAFLSFDSHLYTTLGHPLILTEPICTEVFERQRLTVEKFSAGFEDALKKHRGNDLDGYDGSSDCLNFWLRKAS